MTQYGVRPGLLGKTKQREKHQKEGPIVMHGLRFPDCHSQARPQGDPAEQRMSLATGPLPLCQGPSVTRLSVLPTVRALNVQPSWSLEFLGNPLRVQVFCSLQREATCVQAPCRNMLKAESQGGENKSHPQPPRQSYWLAFPRQLQRHGMRFFSTKKQHTYFC